MGSSHFGAVAVVAAVVLSACAPAEVQDVGDVGNVTVTSSEETADVVESGEETCAPRSNDAAGWASEVVASPVVLAEGGGGSPRVEAVLYPHPDYEGDPWSQWGVGIVLDDGRFLSAIGDHRGRDGNSYVYEYDPASRKLTQILDVLSIVEHEAGDWGFGKIHAPMVAGPCGAVTVATYWGSRHDLEFTQGYQGDVMISIDPERRTASPLGVVYPGHGVPSLAASPDRRLLYIEAVDPRQEEDTGAFVVQDATDGSTVFVDDDPSHTGFRSVAVDSEGRALYSIGEGRLAIYDPRSNARSEMAARLPGAWLRAATEPDETGFIYGVTSEPDVFFELSPDGEVRTLSDALGYTAALARSPRDGAVYSVPEAHGRAWELGAPLIATQIETGAHDVVVELQPLVEDRLGLLLGGSYNVVVDEVGSTVYIGMNAGSVDSGSGFGEVVLIIVTLE